MIPDRFIPDRTLDRTLGRRIPRRVQVWATLYRDGWTLVRIAADTGWSRGRKRQPSGAASPEVVRKQLRAWGVMMRPQGGRGSIGNSVSVRVAELEWKLGAAMGRIASLETALFGSARAAPEVYDA